MIIVWFNGIHEIDTSLPPKTQTNKKYIWGVKPKKNRKRAKKSKNKKRQIHFVSEQ